MSRAMSAGMKAHLALEVTSVCSLWRVMRVDGVLHGFTDCDEDITYNGLTYVAAGGYTASAVVAASDLSVDEQTINGFLLSSGLTAATLEAGAFDNARVTVMGVCWADLSMGHWIKSSGTLADNQRDGLVRFSASQNGITSFLQNTIGDVEGPDCPATLGDNRCKVDLPALTVSASVSTVFSNRQFTSEDLDADSPAPEPGWYNEGLVTWTSGSNSGLQMEVKDYVGESVELQLSMPYPVQVGDTFDISPGCDKTTFVCVHKFNNIANNRSLGKWVPGNDRIVAGL